MLLGFTGSHPPHFFRPSLEYSLYPQEVTSRLISNYILLPAPEAWNCPPRSSGGGTNSYFPHGENKSGKACVEKKSGNNQKSKEDSRTTTLKIIGLEEI